MKRTLIITALSLCVAAISWVSYSISQSQERLLVPYQDKEITFLYNSKHNHIVRINMHYFFEPHDRTNLLEYSGRNSVDRCFPEQCGQVYDETFFFSVKKKLNKEVKNRIYAMGVATIQGHESFSATYFSRTIHELYLTKGEYEITLRPRLQNEKMNRFRKELAVEWGPLMGPLED